MSEPRLGVEQLERGGWAGTGGSAERGRRVSYLTAARIARRWFPSCQSPGNSSCLLKCWAVGAQSSAGTEKQSRAVFQGQVKKQARALGCEVRAAAGKSAVSSVSLSA